VNLLGQKLYGKILIKVSKLSVGHSTVAVELDWYLAEPLLKRTEYPLVWLHERKLLYPRLYLLV